MHVSHIISDIENLGPGRRVGVWFCGCSKNCPSCCSPELQTCKNAVEISPEELASIVNFRAAFSGATGITLSGGDPLEQEDIVRFLSLLNTPDVLVFTGYSSDELRSNGLFDQIKEHVAVLQCGRYIKEKDVGHPLMGSENQELIFLSPLFRKSYEAYIITHSRNTKFYQINQKIYFTGLPGKGERNYEQ